MAEIPLWLEVLERFFVWLTAGVVAFGILLVETEALHWMWMKVRAWQGGRETSSRHRGGAGPKAASAELVRGPRPAVRRFDTHQRIQHFLLMSTFIILALTGLAQKFYRFGPAASFIELLGGMEMVRTIHRAAGWAMIFDGAYHLAYLTRGVMSGQNARWQEMVPNLKDFQDFFGAVRHWLGFTPEGPRYGRFSFMQKFDYWAVFWGLTIMGVSGVVMFFPGLFSRLGGTPAIAAALAAHSDEAILAVAWILVVHMFHAHLHPHVFPFSTTIFSGKISARRLAVEHPLELEQMAREGEPVTPPKERTGAVAEPATASSDDGPGSRPWRSEKAG